MDQNKRTWLSWIGITDPTTEQWKGQSHGGVAVQVFSVGGADVLRIRVEDCAAMFAPSVVQLSDGADLHFTSKHDARAVVGALINALQQQAAALDEADAPK